MEMWTSQVHISVKKNTNKELMAETSTFCSH